MALQQEKTSPLLVQPTPLIGPRGYVIEEYTKTVCPHCIGEGGARSDDPDIFKDGMLVSHDGSIWLRRFCRKHGETESLYEEDAAIWKSRSGWSTPTLRITPDRPENDKPFPAGYREGLPISHGQHTCILLLNITDRCNFGCTTCYASAKAPGTTVPEHERPDIPDILNTVQTVIRREGGKLGVLMLSGGEPTIRKDLPEIILSLLELPITRIMINTNGRRIARDDAFLDFLRAHRDRIEVYLQFDGFRPSTSIALRDEDVAAEKVAALKRLDQAGIFVTLVTTVRRGVNEDELGEIAKLGLATSKCAGITFQPMFGSGRVLPYDPKSRATPTGVLRRLGEQTGGLIDATDFIPLPCSHKDCCDITYLLPAGQGKWKSLPKLIGREELKNWIGACSNTITFENLKGPVVELIRSGILQRVFSEQQKIGTLQLMRDIAQMCGCVPGLPELISGMGSWASRRKPAQDVLPERMFRITVKMFMDANTFHEARIRQCCVHTGTFEEDPRRYSFCWRWLFGDAGDFGPKEAA